MSGDRDEYDSVQYNVYYQMYRKLSEDEKNRANVLYNELILSTKLAEHVILRDCINQINSERPVDMSDGVNEYEEIIAAQDLLT